MRYRYSYSYSYSHMPQTLYRDGDLINVVIVMPNWLIASAVIDCRPVGVMAIADDHGEDAKITAVQGIHRSALQKRSQVRLSKRQHFSRISLQAQAMNCLTASTASAMV